MRLASRDEGTARGSWVRKHVRAAARQNSGPLLVRSVLCIAVCGLHGNQRAGDESTPVMRGTETLHRGPFAVMVQGAFLAMLVRAA